MIFWVAQEKKENAILSEETKEEQKKKKKRKNQRLHGSFFTACKNLLCLLISREYISVGRRSVLVHRCAEVWNGNPCGGPGMPLIAWLPTGFIKYFVTNLKQTNKKSPT